MIDAVVDECTSPRFERMAVTQQQVQDYNLLTGPTQRTDTRAARHGGDDLVFLREDGAPMHTDTPTALMPKPSSPRPACRTPGCTTCDTFMRPRGYLPVYPRTWSPLGSVTRPGDHVAGLCPRLA